MIGAPVTGKDSLLMNFKQNVNVKKENSGVDSFSKVMEKNQKNDYTQKTPKDNYDSTTKGKTQIENAGKKVLKEQKVTESKLKKSSEDGQPIEAMDEAAQKVVEAVAKELGISVDEVMNALQNLNLTPMDLLQMDNMGNLLIELSGDGDLLNLLTDENMFQSLKQLNEMVKTTVEELKETFSLTDEAFAQLLQEGKSTEKPQNLEVPKDVIIPKDITQNVEQGENTANQEATNKTTNAAETKTEIPMEPKAEPSVVAVKETDSNTSVGDASKGKVETQKVETIKDNPYEEATNQEDLQEETKEDGSKNQSEQSPYQNAASKLNMEPTVKNEATLLNQSPDTERIMKQIMDYMKIQVKADATQMEIQLHPANLGTINIQISSKEGVITAQFTAQNEGVKAALEGQIVQLKENFNEQGLKVEAVEVTVASHQFERNMNQGNQDAANSQEAKKKGIRRINLDQMDALEEEGMEEADKLTADMMVKNGNTVDYTA